MHASGINTPGDTMHAHCQELFMLNGLCHCTIRTPCDSVSAEFVPRQVCVIAVLFRDASKYVVDIVGTRCT